MYKLYLASQSPRRADILRQAGLSFVTCPPLLSEILNETVSLEVAIQGLAEQKAREAIEQHNLLKIRGIIVLAADTLVECGGKVMGKPQSRDEAREFLGLLSGRQHRVLSGFCLYNLDLGQIVADCDATTVTFKSLSGDVVEKYLNGTDWQDKAGAYGIQSEGRHFIEGIDGSFSNVMGLPIEKVLSQLKKHGWTIST